MIRSQTKEHSYSSKEIWSILIANSLCDLSSFGTGLTNSEVNSKTVGQQAAPLGVRILNLSKFPYDMLLLINLLLSLITSMNFNTKN